MKKTFKNISLGMLLLACPTLAWAQAESTDTTTLAEEQQLQGVEVTMRRPGMVRMKGAMNGSLIGKEELFKAACCNLGESFVTNPSVDVNYNDAATGARQIKLLGLSGIYVQMLTEQLPNYRGAAVPYALGYVPGPWMKSIQVSKGSASVKNGYESLTGQINVEYLKPDDEEGLTVNLYGDTESRFEANADANLHIATGLSTELLAHYENRWGHHDGNGDGFQDMPAVRQYNLQNRWKYRSSRYIFHGGLSLTKEDRTSGQAHTGATTATPPYRIGIGTDRYEGYMKHAFILDPEHNTNIALMGTASLHELDATYGHKSYWVNEKNLYTQLLFETDLSAAHNLALGLSLNHDYLDQRVSALLADGLITVPNNNFFHEAETVDPQKFIEKETTPGAYAQYTLNLGNRLTAIAGLRVDHSSRYGTFFTPRMHLKWQINDVVALRASAGKGRRTPFALAENNYLLASGRQISIARDLSQEEAWNYGLSTALNIPVSGKTLQLNAEYYYTDFRNQTVVDYDSDSRTISIGNLQGKSYSHTMQVDASYEVLKGLTMTAAYRRNIVKCTYGGVVMDKPLTGKYKALLTASYKTPLGLWQFDATLQLNGGGRMPTPYTLTDGTQSWPARYKAFEQLSAQVTRWFRHFSVYIGGENLTGRRQKTPVIGAANPWSNEFEPTLVWGPVSGAMAYMGVRINFGRI